MLGKTTKLHARKHTRAQTRARTHTHLMLRYVNRNLCHSVMLCRVGWYFLTDVSGHVGTTCREESAKTTNLRHVSIAEEQGSQLHCRGMLKYREVHWNLSFALQNARWESGGIDPFIHKIGSRYRCVAGFKPQALYRWGRILRCPLNRRLWLRSISGQGQPFAWRN
jgi:hypothetical protein